MSHSDESFMRLAMDEAEAAYREGEVPVGAVLVKESQVIAAAHNMTESAVDPTAHAEMIVLRKGASGIGNWRLTGATLYVTKEPCIMCAGAMINARLSRLVFGCKDEKYGAITSRYEIVSDPVLNYRLSVKSYVLEDDCSGILKRFFVKLRNNSE